jgi:glycosyltransferase involved in cell wall biosynthesis
VLRAAAASRVPVRIAHSHNDTSGLRARASPARRAYQWLMRRLIQRYATRRVACSNVAGEALFGRGWTADPRAVNLPYGIDLARFADRPNRAALAVGLGLPPDAKVIGHVGRFDPQKNHRRLLEMAAVVLKDDPGARLVLVGDGPLRPEIRRYAEAISVIQQVVFAGLRDDVPAVMAGLFDVFLFPSLYEGLGLVVVEAQAAGVPVLMSDAVPAEAVRMPDRVTSLPLNAPDDAWAAHLRQRLARRDDPRPPFAQRAAALQDFDVHQNVARLEQIYAAAPAPGAT